MSDPVAEVNRDREAPRAGGPCLRMVRLLAVSALVAVFALAVWFRVSSLGALPEHNADESYEGIQLARMLRGKPFTLLTTNNNPLDPFFLALQAPFQLFFSPSIRVLRAPAVISGLLAVIAAYLLGARSLGRGAALIAAALLATLPPAVEFSRIGHEYCQFALVGVIAVHFALEGRPLALAAALMAGLLVHPLQVFLLPVVTPVIAAKLLGKGRMVRRSTWIVGGLASLAAIAGLAALLLSRPVVRANLLNRPALNWQSFALGLERFTLLRYFPEVTASFGFQRRIVRVAVALAFLAGGWQLLRRKNWTVLALLLGVAAQVTALHLLGGPTLLGRYGTHRYGMVLVAPAAMALAVLIDAAFPRPRSGRIGTLRILTAAVLGAASLSALKTNWIDHYARGRETIWTLADDVEDPYRQAYRTIDRDASAGPKLHIAAQEFWDAKPLEYLASWGRDASVEQLVTIDDIARPVPSGEDRYATRRRQAAERLCQGAYVVALEGRFARHGGDVVATALREFDPTSVRRWTVLDAQGHPTISVYRLDRPDAPSRTASRPLPSPTRR